MFEDYIQIVKQHQSERRFKHTCGVIKMAEQIARTYDLDMNKCKLAALLHDIAKEMDGQKQLQLIADLDDEHILNCVALWHSFAGSQYAKRELNVTDEDVLAAVKYHTTGVKTNNLIVMTIYISDYLEEGRKLEGLDRFRNLLGMKSLSQIYEQIAKERIEYELGRGNQLHPLTKELYESFA